MSSESPVSIRDMAYTLAERTTSRFAVPGMDDTPRPIWFLHLAVSHRSLGCGAEGSDLYRLTLPTYGLFEYLLKAVEKLDRLQMTPSENQRWCGQVATWFVRHCEFVVGRRLEEGPLSLRRRLGVIDAVEHPVFDKEQLRPFLPTKTIRIVGLPSPMDPMQYFDRLCEPWAEEVEWSEADEVEQDRLIMKRLNEGLDDKDKARLEELKARHEAHLAPKDRQFVEKRRDHFQRIDELIAEFASARTRLPHR